MRPDSDAVANGAVMDRPKIDALDQIESVVRDIHEMQDAITELKQRLRELPSEIADQVPSHDERVALARYLYWMLPDVPARAIADGVLHSTEHRLRETIGSATVTVNCDRCGCLIECRSRSHMQSILESAAKGRTWFAEGYRVVCDPCVNEIQAERNREYQAQKAARLRQLQTMRYSDYLKTPEWQARREEHLQSVGYRCQVCNTRNTTLNVHHRTYERRGQEHYTDLIVLCRTCHKTFHENGRLFE